MPMTLVLSDGSHEFSSMFLALFITMETDVDILDTEYTVLTNGLESSLTKSQCKQSVL